jgi:hypothetical protein
MLPACAKHVETDTRVIRPAEYDFILVFALDASPGFAEKQWDAPAHAFFVGSIDRYFRSRSEPEDRVLLTQLTEDGESPLLWQGRPRDLRHEFDSPEALKQLLRQHAKPTKNPYASLANTLEYVSDLGPVRNGAKAVIVVLSDMMTDDAQGHEEDQARMTAALKHFATRNHEIGFWWVDTRAINDIKKCFREAGLPEPQFQIMEKNPPPLTFE